MFCNQCFFSWNKNKLSLKNAKFLRNKKKPLWCTILYTSHINNHSFKTHVFTALYYLFFYLYRHLKTVLPLQGKKINIHFNNKKSTSLKFSLQLKLTYYLSLNPVFVVSRFLILKTSFLVSKIHFHLWHNTILTILKQAILLLLIFMLLKL